VPETGIGTSEDTTGRPLGAGELAEGRLLDVRGEVDRKAGSPAPSSSFFAFRRRCGALSAKEHIYAPLHEEAFPHRI
jgi:hypothetical protein